MRPESTRKILVAGMGTSPAVLTNAVWVCKIFVEDTSNIQRIL
jgi:hypothetical protein